MRNEAEKQLARLYTLPPEEFTKARDELARELRKAGERDEADQVKSLRRPTVAAWVVNKLARQEKMNVRALLTAGERLRDAHASVLRGESPSVLGKARAGERKAIEALARSAARILRDERGKATDPVLDDVRGTLHAAAVDPAMADQLRAGRLTHETQALGFGFETAPPRPGPTGPKAAKRKERDGRRRAAEKRLADAQARVDEARKRMKESDDEVRRALNEHKRAERQAQRLKEELRRAEAAAEEAEQRLRRLDGE